MSANIPVNMRLDDLLKATGYNCPVELQGKTFDEATSGGGDIPTDWYLWEDITHTYYYLPFETAPDTLNSMKYITIGATNLIDGPSIESMDVSNYTKNSGTEFTFTDPRHLERTFTLVTEAVPIGGGGGGDISLTTTTLEGFIGSSYGIILCDENGVPLKVDNIATFDLTKIKYIYEGQEYSGTMHDLTEVSDLHWDSEGSQLIWNDEANTVYLDSTESTAYPLIKFLRHNFD